MIPFSLNSREVKKGICPSCGAKNRFVFYANNETKEKIGYKYGKCDRIESCKYHLSPNSDCVSISDNYTPPLPKPILYHSFDLVTESGRCFKENNFVQFLKLLVKDELVEEAILKYFIGTSKKWRGATAFWQIDQDVKARHCKIMLYDKKTGKRAKNEAGKAFISSARSELDINGYELKQCLFGLHLINETNTETIAIVEAEKTAIICSIFMPEYLWLSCGSLQGFKYEMLKPVKGYKIVAYPDKGCFQVWNRTARELNSYGFDIIVSDTLEIFDVPEGVDLADIFIEQKLLRKTNKPVKLLSEKEMIALKLGKKNPAFNLLVNTFDCIIAN